MMTEKPKSESALQMVEYLFSVDEIIHIRNQEAGDERSKLYSKILEIYHGPNHAQAHHLFLQIIPRFKYKTSRILFGQFKSPMTPDILEISVMILAEIIKGSGWDGTAEMLHRPLEEWPNQDPYLLGCIGEHFCLDYGTHQEVMFTTRRFLYSENKTVVRAALTVICGWLNRETFVDADDFLQELKTLAENSDDDSIKRQVQEIMESQEYNISPD